MLSACVFITWKPKSRASSMILFLVIPGRMVPTVGEVVITLPYRCRLTKLKENYEIGNKVTKHYLDHESVARRHLLHVFTFHCIKEQNIRKSFAFRFFRHFENLRLYHNYLVIKMLIKIKFHIIVYLILQVNSCRCSSLLQSHQETREEFYRQSTSSVVKFVPVRGYISQHKHIYIK